MTGGTARLAAVVRGTALALALCVGALPAGAADASSDGPFWFAPPSDATRFRLTLETEGVPGTVAHAPNLPGGGHAPASRRPRFASGALGLGWRPSSAWHVRARLDRRTLASVRDAYAIDGAALGVARRLPSPHAAARLALVLDARGNRAEELYKNSWTEIGDARLTGARLHDARDDALALALAARAAIGARFGLSVRIGAGVTRTAHARLTGVGDGGDGCRYGFEASGGTGTLTLLEPCDGLDAFREEYANEGGIERRLGFAPSADLSYTSRTHSAALGLDGTLGRADFALVWSGVRHARNGVDERLRARGFGTVTASHTTSLRASFAATRALRLHAGAHYRSTAYLDELALLYGAFTAGRFVRDTLSFGAGLSIAF